MSERDREGGACVWVLECGEKFSLFPPVKVGSWRSWGGVEVCIVGQLDLAGGWALLLIRGGCG